MAIALMLVSAEIGTLKNNLHVGEPLICGSTLVLAEVPASGWKDCAFPGGYQGWADLFKHDYMIKHKGAQPCKPPKERAFCFPSNEALVSDTSLPSDASQPATRPFCFAPV